MLAISLWQPWASAMASGLKQNETRSWATSYRGDLLICSAQRRPKFGESELWGAHYDYDSVQKLSYGCALCMVELYDVVPTELFHGATPLKLSQREASLGDYNPGRFAWLTRNLRPLPAPRPVTGRQGLFNVDL